MVKKATNHLKKFLAIDKKEKVFLSIFALYVAVTAIIIWGLYSSFPKIKEEVKNDLKIAYDINPRTEDTPELTLIWGGEKKSAINPADISGVIPFGAWLNGDPKTDPKAEPQTGLELHLKTKHSPIYSYTDGTLVWVSKKEGSGESEISVRSGSKYAVKYFRVSETPSYLNVGDKVGKGDLLGYTSAGNGFDIWKIEVDKLISSRSARALNPLDFFDQPSKTAFQKLENESGGKLKLAVDPTSNDAGWIAYVGKAEIWASVIRMGFRKNNLESAGEFSKKNNLGWILNEEWQN